MVPAAGRHVRNADKELSRVTARTPGCWVFVGLADGTCLAHEVTNAARPPRSTRRSRCRMRACPGRRAPAPGRSCSGRPDPSPGSRGHPRGGLRPGGRRRVHEGRGCRAGSGSGRAGAGAGAEPGRSDRSRYAHRGGPGVPGVSQGLSAGAPQSPRRCIQRKSVRGETPRISAAF